MKRIGWFTALFTVLLAGCAVQPPKVSEGHLAPPPKPEAPAPIPAPVQAAPALPPPAAAPVDEERYTVVVDQVPVRDLLFALARDAHLNIDIQPGIEGQVTLNAVDQTLQQILERLSRQVDIRYRMRDGTLVVSPDLPFARTYRVDYLNMDRDSQGRVALSTRVGSTGGTGTEDNTPTGNDSSTSVENRSRHRFWYTLVRNVLAVLGDEATLEQQEEGDAQDELPITDEVIPHPEAGLLTVVATERQHRRIRELIDRVEESTQRQVLVEATVVEVDLSYEYQTGVDWSRLADGEGFTLVQNMLGQNLNRAPFFLLNYRNPDSAAGDISASIKMLEQFGKVKILSSPKAMVLNNQTAVLKVVDNKVYFTLTVENNLNQNIQTTTVESTLHTVPVGFVMTVTPQISESGAVIMDVRPTVSRIIGYVNDPNPVLADSQVESRVPEIQVREIESVLKVGSGQIAVLGGLMQDTNDRNRSGIPGLRRTAIGDAFGYHDDSYGKTELVIFLKPTVIHSASLDADLHEFGRYLERARRSEVFKP